LLFFLRFVKSLFFQKRGVSSFSIQLSRYVWEDGLSKLNNASYSARMPT